MTVADIIKRLGGSTEAAQRLGLKRTAIQQWVARDAIPARHAWGVADALGVPVDTLRHLTTASPARPDLSAPQPRQEAA